MLKVKHLRALLQKLDGIDGDTSCFIEVDSSCSYHTPFGMQGSIKLKTYKKSFSLFLQKPDPSKNAYEFIIGTTIYEEPEVLP